MADAESKGAKSKGVESQGNVFDEGRLQRLVELMKEHDLRELELRHADEQIRICRAETPPSFGPLPGTPYPAHAYPPPAMPQPPPAASPSPAAAASGGSSETEGDHIRVIKSPMVGTFYARPNPDAQPYVKVGDHIEPETTICIIEAMKVFNEIPAEISGKVVAVLVESEEPVEFGKPLFKVDTRG